MLDVQRDAGVAKVFLDRRAKANALDSSLLERLAAVARRGDGAAFHRPRAPCLRGSTPAAGARRGTAPWRSDRRREALRVQKQLLQLWEEQPLSESVRASIDLFGEAYGHRPLR